nr:retrovirus-related Pol polyprotein from transposon TNT 1-94 [Tanacetum cinerariifolium]
MVAVEAPQTLEYRGGQLNAAPILENKSLVSTTPFSTAFFSTFVVQESQDTPDDEKDTRSNHEYLNDLEEEYQARSLVAKSKRFFKNDTQRFSSAKATDQTECHKCGKKCHFARDCWSKTLVPSYQSPFLQKTLSSSQHKPELRPTKDFKAKYNIVKAKLALLSSSASASKAAIIKNKGLIVESYEWDEEKVSSDDNEIVEVKVLMALAEENNSVSKEGARNAYDIKVSILDVERTWSFEAEGFILPNHNAGRILPAESQRNTTNPSVVITDSLATDCDSSYNSADEFVVCSTPLPPLKKLDGAEPISGPKTIKSILKSKSIFKAKTLKGVIINESSSAPAKDNESSSASKVNLAPAGKLKSVKIKYDPPLAIVMKELNNLKLQFFKNQSSYSRNTQPQQDISLEREINLRNLQHAFKRCEAYGSSTNTTTDHYGIEWFKSGEALQDKKAEALKSTTVESSNANRSKTPTRRHMTGVKSYLYKYVEQPGPKAMFRDDSTCTTEGSGSIKCNGIASLSTSVMKKRFLKKNSSSYTPEQNGVAEKKNRTLIEASRTMLLGSVFSKQYWTKAVATACYTQNRSTIMKRHLKTPYEIFCKRIPNINFLHVFECPDYIHNYKDNLGKFDKKAYGGYLLGYSLVSKAFRVFNTRRQQTKETYHITFDESPDAIKFSRPLVDNINIAETGRYPSDEYLYPYETSQRYQTNSNDMSFIEPYECPEPVVLKTEGLFDQNGQANQNDQSAQTGEILNDDMSEHSNHTNDEQIIDNIPNTEDIKIPKHLYQANPKESHLIVVKRIFRKSTSGARQFLGGKLVCWGAKKQQSVAMSSAEAEYVVSAGCCANILWIKSQLAAYDIIYETVPIFCDNTSTIVISNNLIPHSRTKHNDIRYHFITDHILKGDIELHFIPTQYQLANIFTKPLDEPTFKRLIVELESFSQNPSSPEITPKEEPVTLDNPESLNPFLLADQVEFTFDEITFTTNNEDAFTRAPTQYVKYLAEFWYTAKTLEESKIWCLGGKTGGLDQISNKDATILYCLANRVKVDYAKLIWEDIIHKLDKKTREKVFSIHNWVLKPNQTEGPPFTDHKKAICNLDVLVDSKALKPSSQTKKVPQGKKPGAKKKDTHSSLAKNKSPSHPLHPTLVVGEMHKEEQQAPGGLTSLGATSKKGAHPQLSSGHNASADSTAEVNLENSAPNDYVPPQQDQTKSARDGYKLPTRIQVQLRSPELMKSQNESEEEVEADNDTDTHDTSHDVPEDTSIPHPSSPKLAQIQELMAHV